MHSDRAALRALVGCMSILVRDCSEDRCLKGDISVVRHVHLCLPSRTLKGNDITGSLTRSIRSSWPSHCGMLT